ncbi:hypothetical protein GGQ84_001033 [Desulfitispora alkaliphila]|uniref:hypothetical protein n=1 Tax=Desulfitispora alkaliphila TaxID=622674 RepID=UPI003D1C045E
MDYVQEVVENLPNAKRSKKIDLTEIIKLKPDKEEKSKVDNEQIENIKEWTSQLNKDIKKIKNTTNDALAIKNITDEVVNKISNLKLSKETIMSILHRCYSKTAKDKEVKNYKSLLVSLIWQSKKSLMLDIFTDIATQSTIEVLSPVSNKEDVYDLKIWGQKYKRIKEQKKINKEELLNQEEQTNKNKQDSNNIRVS